MAWLRRLMTTMRFGGLESDLDEELRFHLEMRIEEYMRSGMTEEAARLQALRRFGNLLGCKEKTRDMHVIGWMDSVRQDVGYGLRVMHRSPVLAAAALLSLALGIGANTAIFSVMDAVMLRSLPVSEAGQLVLLQWRSHKLPPGSFMGRLQGMGPGSGSTGTVGWSFSYPGYEMLKQQAHVLKDTAAFVDAADRATIFARGEADQGHRVMVSGNFFKTLGIAAADGRLLDERDDKPGSAPAAVLSYPFWHRKFAGDRAVIGESMLINGVTFTVAGVTPPDFFGVTPGKWPDIYVPLSTQPLIMPSLTRRTPFTNEKFWWVQLIARRQSGVSIPQAQTAMNAAFQQSLAVLDFKTPETRPVLEIRSASRGFDSFRENAAKPLWILAGLVGLVLIIACTNVANLLLARASTRARESALRAALGAGRLRIMRQHLTEGLLLSFLGAGLGILVAVWFTRVFGVLIAARSNPILIRTDLDGRVLAFTSAVALVTGIIFGLAPALSAVRVNLNAALQNVSRSAFSGRRRRLGLGQALLVAQIAVALVMVISAGLFLRSLHNLYAVPLGFEAGNLLLFDVDPLRAGYSEEKKPDLLVRMKQRLESVPGVRAVTWSRYALVSGSSWIDEIGMPGRPKNGGGSGRCSVLPVGPDFAETMEMPIILGRAPGKRDHAAAPKVAVVNESYVKKFLSGIYPIGQRFYLSDAPDDLLEIVGVVRDARYTELRRQIEPTIYLPDVQHPDPSEGGVFALKSAADPGALMNAVRLAIREIDPNLPVFNLRTQEAQIDDSLKTERLLAMLANALGVLAALLAAIGLYGMVVYNASRRTAEIGIRLALGASRAGVLRMIMWESAGMVIAGALLGIAITLAVTRVTASFLFGLTPTDPFTIFAATVALIFLAMIAAYLPARRAAGVDPLVALRHE